MALVFVLLGLVLLSMLLVAFLAAINSELLSSKQYAAGATVRQLADSALQVATAQIVDATGGSGGSQVAWASQPGMIRTYDNSGNPLKYFKLYSSDQMALEGSQAKNFDPGLEVPAGWSSQPALFTDLNAPVLVFSDAGEIVPDPAKPDQKCEARYPILDPMARAAGVEGFALDKDRDGTVDASPAASLNPIANAAANPAPMPVKWIYVLEDGGLTTPDGVSSDGKTATWSGSRRPSGSNMIVGRIAFWTDDETAKININTAGEGTYWDTPRVNTAEDRQSGTGGTTGTPGFSMSQPFQKEWQRFPGHPSMTALSPVLFPGSTLTQAQKESIYEQITPRVSGGGSLGGSVKITAASPTSLPAAIEPDADRLYANVDELLLKPDRSANPLIDAAKLERAKFFLTANSRAPEVNLFNQPRVGIWPVHSSISGNNPAAIQSNTTVFDRLIAACSTYGGGSKKRFFFQRRDADSVSTDYSATVNRNRQLYEYLQRLTSENIPGFGGDFLAKYGPDRNQILTSIFDYIRCTNDYDESLATYTSPSATAYQFTDAKYWTGAFGGSTKYNAGFCQVMPIEISPPGGGGLTHGFGHIFTLSEISLAFLCSSDPKEERASLEGSAQDILGPYGDINLDGVVDDKDLVWFVFKPAALVPGPAVVIPPTAQNDLDGNGVVNFADVELYRLSTTGQGTSTGQYRVIEASLLLEAFSPFCGYQKMKPDLHVRVLGARNLRVRDFSGAFRPLFHPLQSEVPSGVILSGDDVTLATHDQMVVGVWRDNGVPGDSWSGYDQSTIGGVNGFRWLYQGYSNGKKDAKLGGGATSGVRVVVPVSGTEPTMAFDSSGEIRIQLCLGADTRNSSNPSAGTAKESYFTQIVSSAAKPENVYQTIQARFPSESFPVPEIVKTGTPDISQPPFSLGIANNHNYGRTGKRYWWTWHNPNGISRTFGEKEGTTFSIMGSNPGFAKTDFSFCGRNGPVQGAGSVIRVENFEPLEGDPNGAPDFSRRLAVPKERDVVRSLVPYGNDPRLIAGRRNVSPDLFVPHPDYGNASVFFAHSLMEGEDAHYGPRIQSTASGLPVAGYTAAGLPDTSYNVQRLTDTPLAPGSLPPHTLDRGDFDNGFGAHRDGPYINKPDDGDTIGWTGSSTPDYSNHPYFTAVTGGNSGLGAYFSPNRKVPSAVMFGSLPSGLLAKIPFQTLLFRPPATFDALYRHPGGGMPASGPPYTTPPDHLLLDLFTMPVVEPWAISEPFSTAGKINMNYQIVPFDYITRSTGVRAVLKNEKLLAIPNEAAPTYKWRNPIGLSDRVDTRFTHPDPLRYSINLEETLKGFEARFDKKDIFRSATEICDIHLVPDLPGESAATYEGMESGSFWPKYRLTGDNSRERPYANIYPRLTTKSNSFKVHMRVQSLKKIKGNQPDTWMEDRDKVVAEYRGSVILERYLDPSDNRIPDFALAANAAGSLDSYYRIRVLSSKKFAP